MAKDNLPHAYVDQIKVQFGKHTEIRYYKEDRVVAVEPECTDESELTFDNYKFLADLFKTTKVTTGLYLYSGGGCPTCGNDGPELGEITFTVSEVVVVE